MPVVQKDMLKVIAIALTTGQDSGVDMNVKLAVMAVVHDKCAKSKPYGNLVQGINTRAASLIYKTVDAALIMQPVVAKNVLERWMKQVKAHIETTYKKP
jgi:hypothetical protein